MGEMSEEAKAARREYERKRRERMTPEQKEAHKAYMRAWRQNNPDRIRENTRRYWERKAAEMATGEL